jgi:DNA-binding beta-propeller fold protein YncE
MKVRGAYIKRMRILLAFFIVTFVSYGEARAEKYIAAEPTGLCGKWLTNPSALALVYGDEKLYVTDASFNRVIVISPSSRRITKIINTTEPTYDIVPSRNDKPVYVLSGNKNENVILVLDAATDKIVETFALGAGYPQSLALNEDRGELYIAWAHPQKLSIVTLGNHLGLRAEINAKTLGRIGVIKSNIYTLSNGYVNVFDAESRQQSAHVPIGKSAYFLSPNPDGTNIAVIHQDLASTDNGKVSFIRTKDHNEIASVTVRGDPASAVFAPTGRKLYVADQQPPKDSMSSESQRNNIAVIDTATYRIDSIIAMYGGIGAGALSADGERAYFITAIKVPDKRRLLIKMVVSVVDTKVGKVIDQIPIPLPHTSEKRCSGEGKDE